MRNENASPQGVLYRDLQSFTYFNQKLGRAKMSINRRNKQTVVYSQSRIHTAIRRGVLIRHTTKWMKLENMVCERGQTQETTNCMIPFYAVYF